MPRRRTIYRVVDEVELADIRTRGRLRAVPGPGYEGKLFWETLLDARRWKAEADRLLGVPPDRTVLAVTVSSRAAGHLRRTWADSGWTLHADFDALRTMNEDVRLSEIPHD